MRWVSCIADTTIAFFSRQATAISNDLRFAFGMRSWLCMVLANGTHRDRSLPPGVILPGSTRYDRPLRGRPFGKYRHFEQRA